MNDKEKGKEAAIKLVDVIEDLIDEKVTATFSTNPFRTDRTDEFKQEIVKILTDPVE